MLAGDKCVLMKERGVMVVGVSLQEWQVLLKNNTGSAKMQMISGVEEAVMRGLSQSEGTSDSQTDLKASWNSWALKLCEMEGGSPHLRSKCLLQRTVLLPPGSCCSSRCITRPWSARRRCSSSTLTARTPLPCWPPRSIRQARRRSRQ